MYSFQGKTWEQMTPEERIAHSILNNTAWAGKQGFDAANPQGYLSQFALGFGGGGGQAPANFWDYSDVNNPYGITGVTETHSDGRGIGFSGSTNHFIVRPNTTANTDTGGVMGPSDDTVRPDPVIPDEGGVNVIYEDGPGEPIAPPPVQEPEPQAASSAVRSSTPFMDAYLRARARVREKGPVSGLFNQ